MVNIDNLLKHGQYTQSLQLLSEKTELSVEDKILKARALELTCDESIFEAELVINDVLAEILILEDRFLEIEARSVKLLILFKFLNFPQIWNEQGIFENIWNNLDDAERNKLQVCYARYLLVSNYVKAYTSVDIDDFSSGSQKVLEAVNIFLLNGDMYYATYALGFRSVLDIINFNITEIHISLEILKSNNLKENDFEKLIYNWILSCKEIGTGNIIEAIAILEKTLEGSASFPWIHIGVIYSLATMLIMIGKYDATIPLVENAISISDKLQVIHHIAYGKRVLADVYYSVGELEKAKILIEDALKINTEILDQSCLSHSLSRASKIYYQLGNVEKAIKFSSEGYNIIEPNKISIIDIFVLIDGYYYKLILLLESGETRQAEEFYQSLNDRYTPGQFKEMDYYMQLFEALLLKYEKRITKKVQAQSIFEKLINEEINVTFITKELKIYAIFHYLELLLHEFNEFQEQEVLNEINLLLSQVMTFSTKHNLISFKLRFTIIEAQLLIIQGDFIKADNLLTELQIALEQQQNMFLKKRVEDQISKLNDIIIKFADSSVHTYTLQERLKRIEIIEYVKKVIKLRDMD